MNCRDYRGYDYLINNIIMVDDSVEKFRNSSGHERIMIFKSMTCDNYKDLCLRCEKQQEFMTLLNHHMSMIEKSDNAVDCLAQTFRLWKDDEFVHKCEYIGDTIIESKSSGVSRKLFK